MWRFRLWLPLLIALFLTPSLHASRTPERHDELVKHSTFLSPPFFLGPGSVAIKVFYDIPFPKGHVAIKSFDGEVVDEMGIPVPLHETYLHHWVVDKYHGKRGTDQSDPSTWKLHFAGNDGICKSLRQHFGLGSETRRTSTWIPGPYGIEIGNRNKIPDGYDEVWVLTVHAIDTRQVEDRMGCTECRCSLYNVTKDESGLPLRKGYIGGLACCYDATQCRMREGFKDGEMIRKLYMKYTVKWVEWSSAIVPVRIYILDVTDTGMETNLTGVGAERLTCQVEYSVPPCDSADKSNGKCVHVKKARVVIPRGGDIIYGVAHQHSGGLGSNLFGQDGRLLCSSMPTYGEGEEAGNESGYIVGMSTCYPKPGSSRFGDGEVLTVESNYSSAELHTGVMGLFYVLVADPQPQPNFINMVHSLPLPWKASSTEEYWWAFLLVGVVVVAAFIVGISYRRRSYISEGYQSI